MNKSVAIFRFSMGLPSETFIGEQAAAYQRYTPSFWGRDLQSKSWGDFEYHACDRFGGFGKLFAAYPSPIFLKNVEQLKQANVMHAHFGPDGAYAMTLAKRFKLPLITTFHGYDVLTDRKKMSAMGGFRIRRYLQNEDALQSYGSKFIAVSKFVQHALLSLGYPEHKIIQHYIGVDINRFKPSNIVNSQSKPYFLSVARHVDFKGIDTLLRAFSKLVKKYPDIQLLQIGDGPLFGKHLTLVNELGISHNVTFLGRQSHEQVKSLMVNALAFCGPSQTTNDGAAEALGIVYCEAGASGIPVLATKHGGIPEVVLDGETGLLVNERDDSALCDAMLTVLLNDQLRKSFGLNARLRMERYFDINKQSVLLENIYDQV